MCPSLCDTWMGPCQELALGPHVIIYHSVGTITTLWHKPLLYRTVNPLPLILFETAHENRFGGLQWSRPPSSSPPRHSLQKNVRTRWCITCNLTPVKYRELYHIPAGILYSYNTRVWSKKKYNDDIKNYPLSEEKKDIKTRTFATVIIKTF